MPFKVMFHTFSYPKLKTAFTGKLTVVYFRKRHGYAFDMFGEPAKLFYLNYLVM